MARPPKQGEKYKGDLTKPIKVAKKPVKIKSSLIKDNDSKNEELNKYLLTEALQVTSERVKKLSKLLENYGISGKNPDKWFLLSMCLACTHIEGFRIHEKGKAGARKKWNDLSHALLFYDVRKKIESDRTKNQSESWACDQLAKVEFYKSFIGGEQKSKKLKNELSNAKNSPLVNLLVHNWELAPDIAEVIRKHFTKP